MSTIQSRDPVPTKTPPATDAQSTPASLEELRIAVRDVPDFPRPGVVFKDITPVLADGRLFASAISLMLQPFDSTRVDAVVGIDARGFIFAAAAAMRLGVGFVPIRKLGKLPSRTLEVQYELEYGMDAMAIHVDALHPGCRVLLVDDLLATGGTAHAAISLLRRLRADIVGVGFFIEIAALAGRDRLRPEHVHTAIRC